MKLFVPKKKSLAVEVSDAVRVSESINNHKPWFNGIKRFIAIRIK